MKCNSKSDPNIIKITYLVEDKKGFINVWRDEKCIEKNLTKGKVYNNYLKPKP
jgi:hypothetical protein